MEGITIVIPAYNAAETLPAVLEELFRSPIFHIADKVEIIVVDDGSEDNTAEVVYSQFGDKVRLIRHRRNCGYGAALKTGIREATYEIVVTMDADGQHDPVFIPKLVKAIKEGADLASGAREGLLHSPLWRAPGKQFIRWLASFLVNQHIPDFNCGLRAFKKKIAQKYLHICPEGFSFSMTLLLSFISRGYEVVFIPIKGKPRQGSEPSKVNIKTGFDTILLLLRIMTLFNPLRVFLPVSLVCILMGILWGLPYLLKGHGLSTGALLLIITGVIVFFMGLLADQLAELRKERYE